MFKLEEVDNLLENYSETDEEIEIPLNGDLVVLHKPFLKVYGDKETFYVAEGTYCNKNDKGFFEADWSLTWVWTVENHPEQWLYYEQDGILVTLHNLFQGRDNSIYDWEFEFM